MKHPLPSLRHRVWVQKISLIKDQQGGFTETWQNFMKIWMQIIYIPSSIKSVTSDPRGFRRSSLEQSSKIYQGWARLGLPLEKGMRVKGSTKLFVILESPEVIGMYQIFALGLLQPSDGGNYE